MTGGAAIAPPVMAVDGGQRKGPLAMLLLDGALGRALAGRSPTTGVVADELPANGD